MFNLSGDIGMMPLLFLFGVILGVSTLQMLF